MPAAHSVASTGGDEVGAMASSVAVETGGGVSVGATTGVLVGARAVAVAWGFDVDWTGLLVRLGFGAAGGQQKAQKDDGDDSTGFATAHFAPPYAPRRYDSPGVWILRHRSRC